MISEPVCDVDEEVSCALHCFCMTLWCPFPPVMLPDLETLSRTERKLSSLVFMLTQVLLQITNNIHHLRYPPSGRHFKACIDCWHWMQEAWLRLLSLVPMMGKPIPYDLNSPTVFVIGLDWQANSQDWWVSLRMVIRKTRWPCHWTGFHNLRLL